MQSLREACQLEHVFMKTICYSEARGTAAEWRARQCQRLEGAVLPVAERLPCHGQRYAIYHMMEREIMNEIVVCRQRRER